MPDGPAGLEGAQRSAPLPILHDDDRSEEGCDYDLEHPCQAAEPPALAGADDENPDCTPRATPEESPAAMPRQSFEWWSLRDLIRALLTRLSTGPAPARAAR
jgi:hypothetical protein